MPTRSPGELESMVGTTVESVDNLPIEAGKVAEFARATTDDDPVYRDPSVARQRGFSNIPAPPTFTRVADFPRHRPTGFEPPVGFDLGFDIHSTLHGEQSYEFYRRPVVGDVLSATATLSDVYRREGRRGGELTLAVVDEEYRDEAGDPVLSTRNVQLETSRNPPQEETDGGETSDSDGDEDHTLDVGTLNREDFVRYAGASGDFVRLHYDEPFAREAGYESVFAQGMLVAGIAARAVREWFGLAAIREFRTRFESQVWPGDGLVVTGSTTERRDAGDASLVDAEFAVETSSGRLVLSGDVTAGG